MITIPENNLVKNDFEIVVSDVLRQLETGRDKYGEGQVGTAYIDWGVVSDSCQNCPSKSIADEVAMAFKEKRYYVYVQRMGTGNSRIPSGTPICYRIHKTPREYNNWDLL